MTSASSLLDPPVSLDEPSILAMARVRAGMADLKESGLGDRLRRLLAHMDRDLGLDAAGRAAAHDIVADLVARRARMLADRDLYPDMAESPVERPLIVTGLPRSGTTLLHSLLAADPANRSPMWWESVRPSPPPGISPPHDPRIAMADRELAELIALQPAMLKSHPYFDEGGKTLMECEALGLLDLRHILRSAFYKVPGVISISLNDDPVAFYAFHRQVLQALQWRRPPKRWALKGTEHHVRLEALKAVYPDAIVIWLHRDPQRVFPSVMELLSGLYEGIAGSALDRPAFGRLVMGRYKDMLDTAMASPLIDHPDVHHMRYGDFIADPIGQVESVYGRYGLPFTPATRDALRSWYDAPRNQGGRYGKFEYTLSSFDVTPEFIEAETRAYRVRFNIPDEA